MDKSILWQIGLAFAIVALIFWQSFRHGRITSIPSSSSLTLSTESVATHARPDDCWVIIDGSVYDVTLYLALHPGGNSRISQYCGADASQGFAAKGGKGIHSALARAILSRLKVGALGETISAQAAQTARTSIQQAINSGTIPAGGGDD